eukprot:10132158-Alexandrium_andersonii.AAC.1
MARAILTSSPKLWVQASARRSMACRLVHSTTLAAGGWAPSAMCFLASAKLDTAPLPQGASAIRQRS